MLILLPPSEGKTPARTGKPLDLSSLVAPELIDYRLPLIQKLSAVSSGSKPAAIVALGLSDSQSGFLDWNTQLMVAPTAPAHRVYTGVLHSALNFGSLTTAGRRVANRRLLVFSTLFGVVRPQDRICAYRMSPAVRLPGAGSLAQYWRPVLTPTVAALRTRGLVVDLRSGSYVNMAPSIDPQGRFVTVKIWQRGEAGQRVAVSHHNKESKGLIARGLSTLIPEPLKSVDLIEALRDQGWNAVAGGSSPECVDVTI